MSEPTRRLSARPSLEQLRKQAKEKLLQLVNSQPDARLADAQFALAREYGFDSWPRLVHHVESVTTSGRMELFEALARDMLAGYSGDEPALNRLGDHFADSHNTEWRNNRVREMLDAVAGATPEPTIEHARAALASQFGFDTWAGFAQAMAQPADVASGPGITRAPPFFRIDEKNNSIEPKPPLTDRDWDAIFAVMEERGITGISSAAMTDSALERLSQLSFVTRINIGGGRRVSDAGLQVLARMPQLEELDVSGWHSPITDQGLEVLRHLGNLRQFHACWPQRITDAGVANLTFCDRLESVNLMGTLTGDGAISALRGKPGLHRLATGKMVTDRGIPLLQDFPAFRNWDGREVPLDLMTFTPEVNSLLLDGPFTNEGLARLGGLNGLVGLNLFWHSKGFTSEGLAALMDLPNLGMVGCDGAMCDDAAMRAFAAIPRLRLLMAQGTVATDAGFAALSQSRSIEYIWGRECPNLRGPGFAALANMPALKGLAVSCALVDDASLAELPRFPALTWLLPMDVPDEGFRHVGRCAQLEKLTCMYCRDTGDAATGHIAGLSRLKHYYAGQTRITDRSLAILGGMVSLEEVELSACGGISNAGLAHLARLPRLRKVSVDATAHVSRAGIAVFPSHVHVDLW